LLLGAVLFVDVELNCSTGEKGEKIKILKGTACPSNSHQLKKRTGDLPGKEDKGRRFAKSIAKKKSTLPLP